MDISIKKTIRDLEESLLQIQTRSSQEKLDSLLSNDFREIGSDGKLYSKHEIIKYLETESAPTFAMSEFEAKDLSSDVVLVTYRVVKKVAELEDVASFRSSLWKRNNGHWQMIFHQGTLEG